MFDDEIKADATGSFVFERRSCLDLRPLLIKNTVAGFVAIALGDIDADDTLDLWAIDETGRLLNLVDDVEL